MAGEGAGRSAAVGALGAFRAVGCGEAIVKRNGFFGGGSADDDIAAERAAGGDGAAVARRFALSVQSDERFELLLTGALRAHRAVESGTRLWFGRSRIGRRRCFGRN